MSVQAQIELKKPALQELCDKIGVHGLRVSIGADNWSEVTFIGDVDISKLSGYADRFFALEEGLLKTFHRRVHFIDEETYARLQREKYRTTERSKATLELLHA